MMRMLSDELLFFLAREIYRGYYEKDNRSGELQRKLIVL